MCPTGYTQSSSPNVCTAGTQNLFDLNFFEFHQFTASSIGNFQHPTGLQFKDSAKLSPIPTMERGFYFTSTSRLVSTVNYIIGPDFTLQFTIRIRADGTIFEAYANGISYFKLAAVSGKVVAYWYLTSTSTSSINSFSSYTYSTYWMSVILYSSQSSGLFTMKINADYNYAGSASGFEFRGQIPSMLCYFGGEAAGGSFTGFFNEIHADNLVDSVWNIGGSFHKL